MPWRFNFFIHRVRSLIYRAHRFFFIPWAITQQGIQSERVVIYK